jgi:alkylhydroperoxidase/carboxymuconolactone decarboxylase family protein YurZ
MLSARWPLPQKRSACNIIILMETINDTYTHAQPIAVWTERCHIKCEMKAPRIDPAVRELAVLSALAALGCGLAAVQGDLWFVAVFSAASVVTIIEAIRRLQ